MPGIIRFRHRDRCRYLMLSNSKDRFVTFATHWFYVAAFRRQHLLMGLYRVVQAQTRFPNCLPHPPPSSSSTISSSPHNDDKKKENVLSRAFRDSPWFGAESYAVRCTVNQDFLHNFCRKSLHNHDRIQMRRGEHHLVVESGLGCNIYRPAWALISMSSVLRCSHLNAQSFYSFVN